MIYRIFGIDFTPLKTNHPLPEGLASLAQNPRANNQDLVATTAYELGYLSPVPNLNPVSELTILAGFVFDDHDHENRVVYSLENKVLLGDSSVNRFIRDFLAGWEDFHNQRKVVNDCHNRIHTVSRLLNDYGIELLNMEVERDFLPYPDTGLCVYPVTDPALPEAELDALLAIPGVSVAFNVLPDRQYNLTSSVLEGEFRLTSRAGIPSVIDEQYIKNLVAFTDELVAGAAELIEEEMYQQWRQAQVSKVIGQINHHSDISLKLDFGNVYKK